MQDPYCIRCQPQVMGAALDLLRMAAATLETEANAVTDNPLVFAETARSSPAAISTPSRSPSPPTMIALAVCEIGSIAQRRIALLVDPALSGLPAFLRRSRA